MDGLHPRQDAIEMPETEKSLLLASDMHIIDGGSIDSLENVTSIEESEDLDGQIKPFKARPYDAEEMERKHSRMRQRETEKEIETGSRLIERAQSRKEERVLN